MRRGDLVTIALEADYGKSRPALIVQSDLFHEHPSITVLPVTGELRKTPLFRVRIEPNPTNGLQKTSEVMVDKAQSVPSDRIGSFFGHVGEDEMVVEIARLTWLADQTPCFSNCIYRNLTGKVRECVAYP